MTASEARAIRRILLELLAHFGRTEFLTRGELEGYVRQIEAVIRAGRKTPEADVRLQIPQPSDRRSRVSGSGWRGR